MPDPRRAVGSAGEDAVAAWYVAKGYEILDRNWRVRAGEIDLIARRMHTLVFCEVKTRRSTAFGAPVEAITHQKQRRLRALAGQWLAQGDVRSRDLRFDVASVVPNGNGWTIEVLEAAF